MLGRWSVPNSGICSTFKGRADVAIRDHFGIAATGNAALQSPEAQAAAAVQAITAGISRVVSIRVANGLDTHFDEWTTDQGPIQERGFNAVARMVEALDVDYPGVPGKTWLDFTTIIGFSEFSRTAMLNVNTSRDRSLTIPLPDRRERQGTGRRRISEHWVGPRSNQPDDRAARFLGRGRQPELPPGLDVRRWIARWYAPAPRGSDVADLRVPPLLAVFNDCCSSIDPATTLEHPAATRRRALVRLEGRPRGDVRWWGLLRSEPMSFLFWRRRSSGQADSSRGQATPRCNV